MVVGDTRVELVTPSVSCKLEALSPLIYHVTSGVFGAAKVLMERTLSSSLLL